MINLRGSRRTPRKEQIAEIDRWVRHNTDFIIKTVTPDRYDNVKANSGVRAFNQTYDHIIKYETKHRGVHILTKYKLLEDTFTEVQRIFNRQIEPYKRRYRYEVNNRMLEIKTALIVWNEDNDETWHDDMMAEGIYVIPIPENNRSEIPKDNEIDSTEEKVSALTYLMTGFG